MFATHPLLFLLPNSRVHFGETKASAMHVVGDKGVGDKGVVALFPRSGTVAKPMV